MLEKKFRIWEPLNKVMYDMNFSLYRDHGNEKKTFALPEDNQSLRDSYCSMNLDAIVTMQYTGLKDKNQVEIYEGDILEADSSGTMLGDTFYTGFQGYDRRIVVEDIRKIRFWKYTDKITVVGNIYQNADLLEVK